MFRARLFVISLWCLVLLPVVALPSSATGVRKLWTVLLPSAHILQMGDWVLRSGISADSRLIQSVSKSRFSHIGIVVQTQPQVLVAHATTDDEVDKPNQVLITPLADFASAYRADGLAVLRPRFLTPQQRMATAHAAAQQKGRAFILQPREKTHFYCTTLLLNAIVEQHAAFQPQWQRLDVPVFRGEYLFPQAFTQADVEWVFVDVAP